MNINKFIEKYGTETASLVIEDSVTTMNGMFETLTALGYKTDNKEAWFKLYKSKMNEIASDLRKALEHYAGVK